MNTCFKLNGETICIRVPILVGPEWHHPDPKDTLTRYRNWISIGEAAGPQPDPWKVDVVILATIEALSKAVADEQMRGQLTETIRTAHKTLSEQLPAGVELQAAGASAPIG